MEEVESSILSSSTLRVRGAVDRANAFFLGGLVAGEGYFSILERNERFSDGSARKRFRFGISMASRDRPLLIDLACLFGVGSVRDSQTRVAGHLPISTFIVDSVRHHKIATIPFAAAFIPPSQKRVQFEAWRDALLAYERDRPTQYGRGPSTCSEPDCDRPVRGRGLCRSHYFRATGY
jgi:hypothetical protein